MIWISQHLQTLRTSLARLVNQPGASLSAITVIAITLALPMLLYCLLGNVDRLEHRWRGQVQLSVFFKLDTKIGQQQQLQKYLTQRSEVDSTELISSDQARDNLARQPELLELLELLPNNPLPATLVVVLDSSTAGENSAVKLRDELIGHQEVDKVFLDLDWIQRLHGLVKLAKTAVWLIGCLLAIAVFLIISNTIRLGISARRDEIEISQLVGASTGYIRRPFLYYGLFLGLFGAMLAWIIVAGCLHLLNGPVVALSQLYGSGLGLQSLAADQILPLLLTGAVLGWLAALIAVSRHLFLFGKNS